MSAAPNAAVATTPYTSFFAMVSTKYLPIPFHAKIDSVSTAPVKAAGTANATLVATGISDVRRACRRTATPRRRPLARARRT